MSEISWLCQRDLSETRRTILDQIILALAYNGSEFVLTQKGSDFIIHDGPFTIITMTSDRLTYQHLSYRPVEVPLDEFTKFIGVITG